MVRFDHRGAQSRHARVELRASPLRAAACGRRGEELVGRVDPRLGFCGTGLCAAAKPREFGSREIAPNLFGGRRSRLAVGLGFQQLGVAA